MDELFWKPNWRESSDEELFPKLEKALSPDDWVLDGNYTRTIPIKWKRVQMVVYLDLPFHIVLYRVIKRSLIRGFKTEELSASCTEALPHRIPDTRYANGRMKTGEHQSSGTSWQHCRCQLRALELVACAVFLFLPLS